MNVYAIAAVWVGLALIASVISIRAGIAVALAEILVGTLAGNLPGNQVDRVELVAAEVGLGGALPGPFRDWSTRLPSRPFSPASARSR